jgi:hypothetical protein
MPTHISIFHIQYTENLDSYYWAIMKSAEMCVVQNTYIMTAAWRSDRQLHDAASGLQLFLLISTVKIVQYASDKLRHVNT